MWTCLSRGGVGPGASQLGTVHQTFEESGEGLSVQHPGLEQAAEGMLERRERWLVGLDLQPSALRRRVLGLVKVSETRRGTGCTKTGCVQSSLQWDSGSFQSFGDRLGNKSE